MTGHAPTAIAQTTVGPVTRRGLTIKVSERLWIIDGLYRQQTDRAVWWSADGGNYYHATPAEALRAARQAS